MTKGRGRKAAKPSTRLWVLLGVGALVCLVVFAILIDSVRYYNKVHSGISVAGVDLGGMTKDEATTTIGHVVNLARGNAVELTLDGKTWTLLPADVGTTMDVTAVVKAAMQVTRKSNFFVDIGTRWKLYFSHTQVPLTGSVDAAKLAAFVQGIATEVDVPPVNAGLTIKGGTIVEVDSVDGEVVDQERLTKEVTARLLALLADTLKVPIMTKAPDVKAEDNLEAKQQAEIMISGDVTVTSGDQEWTITPDKIASYMGFKAEDKNGVATLVPFMDAGKLKPLLDEIAPEVLQDPANASFAHDDTRVWVVAGKDGKQLDREVTAEAITTATLKSVARTAKVVLQTKEPALTSAKAKEMGIKEKLTSYTTKYVGEADRQTNVKKATEYATDVILAPGEEYNFDEQVGPRTPSRGFKEAKGITGPGKLEDVLGGGICQVSTTMFNAVAGGKAGLDITERWNHSIYISHYPKGRDATVTSGGKNLRFKNDMEHYVWITGESNGITTTISVWGTDQGRSTEWTVGEFYNITDKVTTSVTDTLLKAGQSSLVSTGQRGQYLKTKRVVTENGKVIHSFTWTNMWPMYPDKIAVGTASTKPASTTTSSSTTTTTTAGP
jgi:vancomycin resistance protein YoaR